MMHDSDFGLDVGTQRVRDH